MTVIVSVAAVALAVLSIKRVAAQLANYRVWCDRLDTISAVES